MKREFSLSGIGFGLFLIALGVAVFSDLSFKTRFLVTVWRCYPVLPILLGLDFILSQMSKGPESITWVRPAGWLTTLIILVATAGLVSGVVSDNLFQNEFKRMGMESFTPRLPFGSNRDYHRTLHEDFRLPQGITTIRAGNEFGDLRVDTGTANEVSVTARIKYAFQPPNPEVDSGQVKLVGRVLDNTFVVHLEHPKTDNGFLPQFMAVITIKVPSGLKVELKNSFGQLTVGEIQGNLTVDNSNGRVRIRKVNGDATITNRLSQVTIEEIGGNLNLESNAGQVKINRAGKNLSIRQDFGDLKIGEVAGDLTITGKNSSISISQVQGKVQLENNFGSVNIKEALNAVTAGVNNGNLQVRMSQLISPVTLNVEFGSIKLDLPEKTPFSLDARAVFGGINTNLPVTLRHNTGGQSVTGDINGGGPLVKIDARNGSIKIREGQK